MLAILGGALPSVARAGSRSDASAAADLVLAADGDPPRRSSRWRRTDIDGFDNLRLDTVADFHAHRHSD